MIAQHPPESPWLPLLKPDRRGAAGWLRANHKWLISIVISIVALVVSGVATYASLRNTIRSDARFSQERRPWLTVRISKDTLAWEQGLYLGAMQVRNVGAGPALWFYGGGARIDTKQPVATTLGLDPKTLPTRVLPPRDTAFMYWTDEPVELNPDEDRPFYIHYQLFYGGLDQKDTFYFEQVFFVDPRPDLSGARRTRPAHGEECAYTGTIRNGRVILDGRPTPDTALRARATLALLEVLNRLVPHRVVPQGRIPARADSVLMSIVGLRATRDSAVWTSCAESLSSRGFDSDVIEYARANAQRALRMYVVEVPVSRVDMVTVEPGERSPATPK